MSSSPPDADNHAFAKRARSHYEARAQCGRHHPERAYTPRAFRHYHRRAVLFSALRPLKFATVLDVGSSDGYFSEEIAREFGGRVFGLDLAPTAVQRLGARGLRGVVGDGSALPFADAAFDVVISTETLEHVLDAEQLVGELCRVARRWVVVTTPVGCGDSPDWWLEREGHIHGFEREHLQELFGARAMVTSYRANMTYGLYALIGRWLGPRIGRAFIRADLELAARWGSETSRFALLLHRSFIVVAPTG
jgi:hypothetical protein